MIQIFYFNIYYYTIFTYLFNAGSKPTPRSLLYSECWVLYPLLLAITSVLCPTALICWAQSPVVLPSFWPGEFPACLSAWLLACLHLTWLCLLSLTERQKTSQTLNTYSPGDTSMVYLYNKNVSNRSSAKAKLTWKKQFG